ncbi:MAG: hypothetical protein QW328_06945 [Nitrososphaerota archaeon]
MSTNSSKESLDSILSSNYSKIENSLLEANNLLSREIDRYRYYKLLLKGVIPREYIIDLLYRDKKQDGVKLSKITKRFLERLLKKRNRKLFGSKHKRKKNHYKVKRKINRLKLSRFRNSLYTKKLVSIARYYWNNSITKIVDKDTLARISKDRAITKLYNSFKDVEILLREALRNKALRIEKEIVDSYLYLNFINTLDNSILTVVKLSLDS